MRTTPALAVLTAAAALVATLAVSAAEPAVPADIEFDGDAYRFAAREVADVRIAEHYLRVDETLERFSRRFTVADQPQAASAKAVALGVINIAKLRTPGIAPDSFVAEGTEERDVSVAWYDLTDDSSAVEYHVARFVSLAGGGVREYHLTVRRYTNGNPPDAALGALRRAHEPRTIRDVELLSALDRAPLRPAPAPVGQKKH